MAGDVPASKRHDLVVLVVGEILVVGDSGAWCPLAWSTPVRHYLEILTRIPPSRRLLVLTRIGVVGHAAMVTFRRRPMRPYK